MDRLVDPLVELDFYEVRKRGRELHDGAEEFVTFLRGHITSWARRNWEAAASGELGG